MSDEQHPTIDQAAAGQTIGSDPIASTEPAALPPVADVEVPLADRPEITRDEVLAANDARVIIVPVDEWKKGAVVFVHTPSASDSDLLEHEIVTGTERLPKDAIRAAFVIMCVRNKDGSRKFKPEDLDALKKKSMTPMNRIWQAIAEATIITETDVELLAKNSGAATAVIS